jgi:hypothetical protein
MKAGSFNIYDYLERLYEAAEEREKQQTNATFLDGGQDVVNVEGLIIPDENKKSYDWLKSEFQKGKTEVKVEMKFTGAKFEPGYDLQTDLDSVKDFKPGMFGEIKTADTKGKKDNLDPKKDVPSFGAGEGDAQKAAPTKTKGIPKDIKNKEEHEAGESEEKEKKEEHEAGESEEKEKKEEHEASETPEEEEKEEKAKKEEKPEVKKIDLKTKKK